MFLEHHETLRDLYLDPATDVDIEQIRKDLPREVIEVNGTIFSDHTKHTGDLDMFEDILKRSLIFDMIKDDVSGASNGSHKSDAKRQDATQPKAPSDGPPVAPPAAAAPKKLGDGRAARGGVSLQQQATTAPTNAASSPVS